MERQPAFYEAEDETAGSAGSAGRWSTEPTEDETQASALDQTASPGAVGRALQPKQTNSKQANSKQASSKQASKTGKTSKASKTSTDVSRKTSKLPTLPAVSATAAEAGWQVPHDAHHSHSVYHSDEVLTGGWLADRDLAVLGRAVLLELRHRCGRDTSARVSVCGVSAWRPSAARESERVFKWPRP